METIKMETLSMVREAFSPTPPILRMEEYISMPANNGHSTLTKVKTPKDWNGRMDWINGWMNAWISIRMDSNRRKDEQILHESGTDKWIKD